MTDLLEHNRRAWNRQSEGGDLAGRRVLCLASGGGQQAPVLAAAGEALEFSLSLDLQIGAQIAAGFAIEGFYEDRWNDRATPLDACMPTSMATLAVKHR